MLDRPTDSAIVASDPGADRGVVARLLRSRSRRPYLLAAAVFLALAAINAALQPTFLTVGVAASNLSAFLPLTLLAIGETYVVLVSDIDLSNGGIVSLVNVSVVELIERFGQSGGSYAIGVAGGLAIGLIAGAFNGFCVAFLRFQPIVTTFATSVIFVGLALWVLPQAGGQVPPQFYNVYAGATLGVPNVLIALVAAALFAAVVARTRFYQALRAAGGNMQAAFYTGLPVARVRLMAYVLSGILRVPVRARARRRDRFGRSPYWRRAHIVIRYRGCARRNVACRMRGKRNRQHPRRIHSRAHQQRHLLRPCAVRMAGAHPRRNHSGRPFGRRGDGASDKALTCSRARSPSSSGR